MRLIDADELKKNNRTARGNVMIGEKDVDNAPTVEAIPIEWIGRVQAHWKEYESEWYGSWWEALSRLVLGWVVKERENG